ncbi:hypothetical protein Golob_025178, partial [Gossypium lobatum]|nr:hypothetical protein [Gossypium lobatum]
MDKHLFRALAQYWNPAYSCFTFRKVDLVPTIEVYTTLFCCLRIQADKAYSRVASIPNFLKDLMCITRKGEQWLDKWVMLVPVSLVETFRYLSVCQRAGEGRFIGCAQLLLAWFHSHFWKVERVFYQVFSEDYSLLKEFIAAPRRDNISKEKWMVILQSPRRRRQMESPFRSRQFILGMQGLALCDFAYKGDNYKNKWQGKRFNDNVLDSSQENTRLIEEHLQVILSELEIIKAKEDFNSLKTDYKKLYLSIKTTKLGKTSEQWQQENKKEKTRANQWEKKFQDARVREDTLERDFRNSIIELQARLNKIEELKGKIEKLETALQNYELRVELLETNNEHWK